MALLYTKFELNRTYTVGSVTKFTDGGTDRQTDAEGYNIIRPFFKQAYKKLNFDHKANLFFD